MEQEKGWLGTWELIYSSNVGEVVRMRLIEPTFGLGYIFNKNWSFMGVIPVRYEYISYSHIPEVQDKKTERALAIENIELIPRYRFKWKNKWVEFPIGIQIPTLNKISGNIQYQDIEAEKRIFAIELGMNINKVDDPIISSLQISFAQPLWRKKKEDNVYTLWKANIGAETYFLINEQFSYFSEIGISMGKKKEYLLFECGTAYHPKPYQEWRVYLLNNYDGIRWNSSIGLSFTMMQKTKEVK